MKTDERESPWRDRQARWSIPDLALGIKLQRQECNGEERFHDSNDCVSSSCALYPFQRGTCSPVVAGVRRAVSVHRAAGILAEPRYKREMTAPERASVPGAGAGPLLSRQRQEVRR